MPRIEHRTIIAFGRDSHCVILPKSWLEFYGLKKGDKIEMITDGLSSGEIIIRLAQLQCAGLSS